MNRRRPSGKVVIGILISIIIHGSMLLVWLRGAGV